MMVPRTGVPAVEERTHDEDALGRDRILREFNASTLDNVGPMKGDQGMKVLSEMNSLTDEHDQFARSLVSRSDAL